MNKPSRGPKNLTEKVTNYVLSIDKAKDYVFDQAKGKVMKQTQGLYPAPLKILEVKMQLYLSFRLIIPVTIY